MQEKKLGTSIPEPHDTPTSAMSRKHRKSIIALALLAVILLSSAIAQENKQSATEQAPAHGTSKTTSNAAPAAAPTVRTASGVVRGVTDGDVSSFKGIPFAATTAGHNRWRPPQPLPAWKGVRDASKFGPDCAQAGFTRGATSVAMSPTSSEDCLYINLWRPSAASSAAKLPVMVWIFGGGFVFGSGAQPSNSGVEFAKQGVIW